MNNKKKLIRVFPAITRLTFGTGGVTTPGDSQQIQCIRQAMETGLWMHCANYGNGAFQNLKLAFGEAPSQVPKTIFKVDGMSAEGFRSTIRSFLSQVGLDHMDIAQVCGFPLSKDPDAILEAMGEAREEGLADFYVMEIIPKYCRRMMDDIIPRGLFEGYILYHNVMKCQASKQVLAAMVGKSLPLLCLQTFGGGYGGQDGLWNPAKRPPYLEPIFKKSGYRSWVDFSVHYGLSLPGVITTIAGSGKMSHLEELIQAAESFRPLNPALVQELLESHHAWNQAHEVDFG